MCYSSYCIFLNDIHDHREERFREKKGAMWEKDIQLLEQPTQARFILVK
jgi:hypothetical protein